MFRRLHLLVWAAGAATLGMSCADGSFSFNYVEEEPPPHVVVVEAAHVCTPGCAHYYHDGRYVVVKRGHHHGPGCGHHFDGHHWVVVAGPAHVHVDSHPPPAHVHAAPARAVRIPPPPGSVDAYVYDRRGSKWMKVGVKHVHGPHCGHVHFEGHWCLP